MRGPTELYVSRETQVEFARNGTVAPTKWAHISHLKPLL